MITSSKAIALLSNPPSSVSDPCSAFTRKPSTFGRIFSAPCSSSISRSSTACAAPGMTAIPASRRSRRQNGISDLLRRRHHLHEFILVLPHDVLSLVQRLAHVRQVGLLRHRYSHRRQLRALALLWILLLLSHQVSVRVNDRGFGRRHRDRLHVGPFFLPFLASLQGWTLLLSRHERHRSRHALLPPRRSRTRRHCRRRRLAPAHGSHF